MSLGGAGSHKFDSTTATNAKEASRMKYLLQMVVDESYWQNLTPEEMQPMIEAMEGYNDQLRNAGVWVSGEGLDFSSNAKTVRVRDAQRIVEDGPYAPAKEQLAGFWIIDTATIDDAVEWAKKVPLSGGGIEVRGLVPENAYEA
jgi:hypothetical protein